MVTEEGTRDRLPHLLGIEIDDAGQEFGGDGAARNAQLGDVVEQSIVGVAWGGGRLRMPLQGLPMAYPGPIDVVYDTIGKPETFEVGVRVMAARGTLVKAGVHAPGRWEWSPLYFKEISWVGSNAFGFEEVDGKRQHAIAHYLDLVTDGRVDLRPMLTHTFRLEQWRDAFFAIANQRGSGAIKVAFDQR